ncbi:hypothetical protein RKE29_21160 [Streptomyces sp. B1866]|uniref:hypothetical protein n=1 Tax=Streptomyces sp. B1866 TaxID=3075431 RepID=UPI00288FDE55|nr:hypothetical protein [Streptomyces sp. B1866]MDT3399123.1 hypothetical protein [Streptomyces sp. B1866]
MSDWGIALIAAGSALLASAIGGWYGRAAGVRQAEAARYAADRQADALLGTLRATLADQRAVRLLDLRRQTYVQFLHAVEAVALARRSGDGQAADRRAAHQAFAAVLLEGPADVARAARQVLDALRGDGRADDVERARALFTEAARAALGGSGEDGGPAVPPS